MENKEESESGQERKVDEPQEGVQNIVEKVQRTLQSLKNMNCTFRTG